MGAGGGAAVAAMAAARARRVRDMLDAFRVADATAPDRARTLEELGTRQPAELRLFAELGILVQEAGSDRWWLDERAYITYRDRAPKRAVRVLLVIIAIALVLVAAGLLALTRTSR